MLSMTVELTCQSVDLYATIAMRKFTFLGLIKFEQYKIDGKFLFFKSSETYGLKQVDFTVFLSNFSTKQEQK